MYFSCSVREAGNYKLSAEFMSEFKKAPLCFCFNAYRVRTAD